MDKANIRRTTVAKTWLRGIGLAWLFVAATVASFAQGGQASPDAVRFRVLADFNGTNGAGPGDYGQPVVRGTDGNLYGAASYGGVYGNTSTFTGGTVFKITPGGMLSVLYNFCALPNCADGSGSVTLVLGADGDFYGVTLAGGVYNQGTVFRVTPGGHLTTLYSFCALSGCPDGSEPLGIALGMDGYLYGTTLLGGANNSGTVFKMAPGGHLNTIYSFCSQPNCADGAQPAWTVIQDADGNLYGTTQAGNAGYNGTVFKMTPKGEMIWVYNFCSQPNCTDGMEPQSALVQADDGDFYGSNEAAGSYNGGTIFKITPAGTLTTLYSFCAQGGTNCPDGIAPFGAIVQGNDRNFYGATYEGGVNTCSPFGGSQGCGTLFQFTPGGSLTTLHDFNGTDGDAPFAGLMQNTNGSFFGAGDFGGNNVCSGGCGTIFGFSLGLRPFIATVPAGGRPGDTIQILGDSLAKAENVEFNGERAAFTVVSRTLILATVPTCATSGFVTITGPSTTVKSNARFQVRP